MTKWPSHVVPINFALTKRAKDAIEHFTDEVRRRDPDKHVPVIGWREDYEEPTRVREGRVVERGFWLAWHHRNMLPAEAIQTLDGLELVFDVAPEQAKKFDGRTIDFVDGRFRFIKGKTGSK